MFQDGPGEFPDSLITAEWDNSTWCYYRAWAVTRATGRIPLNMFCAEGLPQFMSTCPLCGAPEADLRHVLLVCPCTHDLYVEWQGITSNSFVDRSIMHWTSLLEIVFSGRLAPDGDMNLTGSRIRFVGKVCQRVANASNVASNLDPSIDEFITNAMNMAHEAP